MKLSIGDLIVPALLIGAAGWWGYNTWSDHTEKNRVEQVRQAESAEYRQAVDAMAARHGAAPALTDKLAAGDQVYTYNVQNALLAASGRAVVVNARIVDIEKQAGGYLLHLDDAGSGAVAIRYLLECDAATGQKVIGLHAPASGVTLAATITGVERLEFANAAAKSGGPAPVDGARFVAKGRCLEFVAR